MNRWEDDARRIKAEKLADFLQLEVGIQNVDAVARMKDFQWKLAAAGAKVKLTKGQISRPTREKVLEILGERERVTGVGLRLDPFFKRRLQ